MLEQIDLIRLLAYAAVINGYLHSEQLIFINRIVKSVDEIRIIYEILLSDDTYDENLTSDRKEFIQNLSEQLMIQPKNEQHRLKKILLKLMCYDGSFDEKERELMSTIFPKITISKMTVRFHTAYFRRRTSRNIILSFIENIKSKFFKNVIPFYHSKQFGLDRFIKKLADAQYEKIKQAFLQAELSPISDRLDKYREELQLISNAEATIVVIGRTKAGKSTLFSLLSGTGSELIGKSTQRTSKCTIITHYKGIKIVDTPGLASSSSKGDTDEMVAMDACCYADDILFLMATDTYDDELAFLKELAYMDKPISVLFNYKGNDWFQFEDKLKDLCLNPTIWKNGNNIQGWKNQLLRFAAEYHFQHIFENRIYYAFLRAAEVGSNKKIYPWVSETRKKLSTQNRRNIYTASGFEKCMSDFIRNFIQKTKLFRLAQIVSTSMRFVKGIKTDIEELLHDNEYQLKNCSKEVQDINLVLDCFEKQCIESAEDKIRSILSDSVFSDTDVDKILMKSNNGKFENDITSLLERISKKIYNAIDITLDEMSEMNRLKIYGIEQKNTYRSRVNPYIMENVFTTQGSINPLKSKELYILLEAGLGIFAMGLSLPASLAVIAGEIYADKVIDKKTSSITGLKDMRTSVRWQETAVLFDKMVQYYTKTLKAYIHDYCKNIRNCDKLIEYRQKISDCLKKKKDFEIALQFLTDAEDTTLREFSIKLLELYQRKAKFVRYSVSDSDSSDTPAFYIYATNCKEISFHDMRYIIHIKKEE